MNIAEHIKANDPISCVRISQAKQGACKWPYVDVVPYEIRLTADGQPMSYALRATKRVYRSTAKAERIVSEMGVLQITRIGRLKPEDVKQVEEWINS